MSLRKPGPEHYHELATKFLNGGNCYHIAESLGFEVDDTDLEAIEEAEGIFLCENCSRWYSDDMRAWEGAPFCVDCDPDKED